jgi:hypothetical protein
MAQRGMQMTGVLHVSPADQTAYEPWSPRIRSHGMVLGLDRAQVGSTQVIGLLAVMAATASGGVDNTLSRAVSARDPSQVVMLKGAIGAAATAMLAIVFKEPLPALLPAFGLLLVGATGYGLSLRFYLLAQRSFGAARTGSVFAFAPFVGAPLAVILGERLGSVWMLAGAFLMIPGILIHLAEMHSHDHVHDEMDTSMLIATMTAITSTSTIQCLSGHTVIDISTCPFGTRIRMCRTSTTHTATKQA